MKKTICIFLITCALMFMARFGFSQSTITGFGGAGHTGVATATHFLGWINGTIPLDFQTNGILRMRLQNGTGFLGIGTSNPQNLLHIDDGTNAFLQVTNPATGSLTALDGMKFGMFPGTANGLIAQQENARLLFSTNGAALANVKMVIMPNGNTGIGSGGFINPNNRLDVDAGDIDVNTRQRSYMIGDTSVLWHKGGTTNIFVGVGAGSLIPVGAQGALTCVGNNSGYNSNGTSTNDVYVGYGSGFTNTGNANTHVGASAGYLSVGDENVFIGFSSGYSIAGGAGVHNTFVGNASGQFNNNGSDNSFFGIGSGFNNGNFFNNCYFGASAGATSTGSNNVFMGTNAGQSGIGNSNIAIGFSCAATQSVGTRNTYVGDVSGANMIGGNFNTFIGAVSDAALAGSSFTNAAAIGANAKVVANNNMILGSPSVSVGIGMSGVAGGPKNWLEINDNSIASATVANTNILGTYGASGLRFTKLTSATTATSNPGTGVLTVNGNGDVIYVIGGSGGGLGNLCSSPTSNTLTGNYEIPLAGSNFYFSNDAAYKDKVNVGYSCGAIPPGKLNVTTNFASDPNSTNDSYCIFAKNTYTSTPSGGNNVGVYGDASAVNSTSKQIGIWGTAASGTASIGGNFQANFATKYNIAVSALAYGVSTPTAGPSYPTPANVAIYGQANPPTSGPPLDFAGFFDGEVWINGPGTGSAGLFYASDAMFKTNVDSITNARGIINQLKPRHFYFDTTNTYGMRFPSKKQYGFIAQDVQTVLPELVSGFTKPSMVDTIGNVVTPGVTFKTLNYNAFFAIIIRAIQEQQKTIDSLKTKTSKQDSINNAVQNQIAALTSSINACCNNNARTTNSNQLNQISIDLSDKDIIVLNQNVPNPFAEQTTITYNVPEKYSFAQIIFSTTDGRIIKTVDITKKGRGQLTVFANDLSNGMYAYSLVVDGKIVDTKKMVKQ